MQFSARDKIDTAEAAGLEQRLEDVTTLREKVCQGTMLRGALLTTYGFSELGSSARRQTVGGRAPRNARSDRALLMRHASRAARRR